MRFLVCGGFIFLGEGGGYTWFLVFAEDLFVHHHVLRHFEVDLGPCFGAHEGILRQAVPQQIKIPDQKIMIKNCDKSQKINE